MDAETDAARRSATLVGAVTLPIGVALVLAPEQVRHAARLGGDPNVWRLVGALDLACVPRLLAGRPRWPWLAARAGLNLGIAGYCVNVLRRERATGAALGVVAMVAATIADTRTIAALRP